MWKGWVIAAGLGCTGYLMTLLHHQIFWCAYRTSFARFFHPELQDSRKGLVRIGMGNSSQSWLHGLLYTLTASAHTPALKVLPTLLSCVLALMPFSV